MWRQKSQHPQFDSSIPTISQCAWHEDLTHQTNWMHATSPSTECVRSWYCTFKTYFNILQPEVLTTSSYTPGFTNIYLGKWMNWCIPLEPTVDISSAKLNNSEALMLPKGQEPNLSAIVQSPKCLCVPRLLCDRSRNVPAILFLNKLEGNWFSLYRESENTFKTPRNEEMSLFRDHYSAL